MTFLHEPVQLAFFVQLLELVLQEHLLDLVPLCIDRAFAFGGPFFIDCFQPILGLPFLSVLLLLAGEGAFLDEHCLDRRDHVRIAYFLRLLQLLLEGGEPLVLVLFDELIALRE